MSAKTEEYPNAWIPKEDGDSLTGNLVEVRRGWSDQRANGNKDDGWYPIVRLETDAGVIKDFHCFQTVSRNRILEKRPLPGELVTITYRGEGKAKPGQSAPKLFDIEVAGRDPAQETRSVYDSFGGGNRPAADSGPAARDDDSMPL